MPKFFSSLGRKFSPVPQHQCSVEHPQYSSLMFKGRDEGDTSPLLLLLLVTIVTLPFPWRPPPPPILPLLPIGGVGVVVEEAGCWSFFLLILRSFARRFWNQIFTWNRRKVVFTKTHDFYSNQVFAWVKKTCETSYHLERLCVYLQHYERVFGWTKLEVLRVQKAELGSSLELLPFLSKL